MANQSATFVIQIVIVPLYLVKWSAALYGDWLTLTAMVSYLSLADAGMQIYVINRLMRLAAQERWNEVRRDLSSGTLLYAVVLSTVVTAGAVLAFAWPFQRSFAGRPILTSGLGPEGIVLLLGFQVAASMLSGATSGLYMVIGRADLGQFFIFAQRLVQLIGTILVLTFRKGPGTMAGMQFALTAAVVGVMMVDIRRRDRRLAPGLQGADWQLARSFLGPSLLFLVGALAGNLATQGTVLVVSHVAGAAAVVVFATSRTVASVLRQPIGLAASALAPEIARMDAVSSRDRMAFSHRIMVKATSAMVFAPAAALIFVGAPVYALWTAHRTEPDIPLMRWLFADAMLQAPTYVSAIVLNSTLRHRRPAWLALFIGVAMVSACWLLYPWLGLTGAGVSILGVNTLMILFIPLWVGEAVGETWTDYARRIYLPLGLAAAAIIAAAGLTHAAIPHGLAGIVAVSAASLLAAIGAFWLIVFDAREKAFLLGLLARLRPSTSSG